MQEHPSGMHMTSPEALNTHAMQPPRPPPAPPPRQQLFLNLRSPAQTPVPPSPGATYVAHRINPSLFCNPTLLPAPPASVPAATTLIPTTATALDLAQSEYSSLHGPMRPHPSIAPHPAFPLLMQYAKMGCPVDCGPNWSKDHLQAAINRGNHPSARSPEALHCLWTEALEKVQTGLARLVAWDDIKACPPPNLKISPLAAVPHKSRRFRAILDLSF